MLKERVHQHGFVMLAGDFTCSKGHSVFLRAKIAFGQMPKLRNGKYWIRNLKKNSLYESSRVMY